MECKNAHNLLRKLRQIYLVDLDENGEPKANVVDMVQTWTEVNKELKLKQ